MEEASAQLIGSGSTVSDIDLLYAGFAFLTSA